MIHLTILYPAIPDGRFDFEYYLNTHMPLSEQLLGDYGLLSYEVDRCISTVSGAKPDFVCITQLQFTRLEDLRAGMQAHGAELRADFEHYTNITPVATVCEAAGTRNLNHAG